MIYKIYVISNADLFREGLNAIAAFCTSPGFKAAIWMGSAIGIMMTAFAYVKQRDVLVYLKWLVAYFFVFHILLGVPSTVAVISTADQTKTGDVIANVPLGIALPAHFITAIGYDFSSDLETVFSLPTEVQYHKTGMLFGSNLFRLSLASQLDDPGIMNDMNNYVRSCVIGDILINHKYTFQDLLHSRDVWALMTKQPSPIRGVFMDRQFKTCAQAAPMLTNEINQYASKTAPAILARFIPTRNAYAPVAINTMLDSTYDYFKATSKTGTNILRQNIAINAFRSGIKNYAAETGSIAGLENMANTMAMNNTRMAWATSRHMGIQTLPLMQVVMLLLLLCIFPLIAVLTLIPNLGFSVFKNYLYSLLWLETWPILYTILNMAMNFYLSASSHGAVTLSNINLLAQEHSDIAGVAGYLVLAIPFLSLGIVKGMAFTFNNAAQYLGGMMHSIAQGSAVSVAMGNYSLGNVSTDNATANNLNANKHDTNFTSMQGLSTQQLGNGVTVTATPMGHDVYSTAQGMSQLATSAHAAESAAASLSQQADHSITSALAQNTQYMHSRGQNDALVSSATSGVSSHVDHAMSTISSLTNSLAQKEGITTTEASEKLTRSSMSASATAREGVNFLGSGGGFSQSASVAGATSSKHDGGYTTGADKNISASDARDFRDAVNTVKNYSQTHHYSNQNTNAQNLAIQTGADFNNAERLASTAQFIRTHSDTINTNFNQVFSNQYQTQHPEDAKPLLSATGDPFWLGKQRQAADQFIQTNAHQLANQFASDSAAIHHGFGSSPMQQRAKYATQNYQRNAQHLVSKGKGLGVNAKQAQTLTDSVSNHLRHNQNTLVKGQANQQEQRAQLQSSVNERVSKGKAYAEKGVTRHIINDVKDVL